jgi:hypothetical protein
MLGNDSGAEAPDAIDELLGRIKDGAKGVNADGGNGSGNNGVGQGGGGGDGEDPLKGQPVDARILIEACRQMAGFMKTMILTATERTAELLAEKTVNGLENERDAMLAVSRQLHENAMATSEVNVLMAKAANDRFEALERRLAEIERALGWIKPPVNEDKAPR